jgi:hypothetical protein
MKIAAESQRDFLDLMTFRRLRMAHLADTSEAHYKGYNETGPK